MTAIPKRIIGPFPDGRHLVLLEGDGKSAVLPCESPYHEAITRDSFICDSDGHLSPALYDGRTEKCLVVDREGLMSYLVNKDKSGYSYGAGLAIYASLHCGCPITIDDDLMGDVATEKAKKLEDQVGLLFPLPKLETTSFLRAACEFLGL